VVETGVRIPASSVDFFFLQTNHRIPALLVLNFYIKRNINPCILSGKSLKPVDSLEDELSLVIRAHGVRGSARYVLLGRCVLFIYQPLSRLRLFLPASLFLMMHPC
jgi:hypothetical protein